MCDFALSQQRAPRYVNERNAGVAPLLRLDALLVLNFHNQQEKEELHL